jgi:hypothetical protein
MKSKANLVGRTGILIGVAISLAVSGLVAFSVNTAYVGATPSREVSVMTDTDDPKLTSIRCSNETLSGSYAVKGDGMVTVGPPPMVPFAVVSLMTMDGAGNLTDKATVSVNGQTGSTLNSGTYNIGPDCTGTLTINIPNPPFVLNSTVVLSEIEPGRAAKGFYFIGNNTGSLVTHVATRVY